MTQSTTELSTLDRLITDAVYEGAFKLGKPDLALNLPLIIRRSGVLQALAFLEYKGDGEAKDLRALWAKGMEAVGASKVADWNFQSLCSTPRSTEELMLLTELSLRVTEWIRRLAQARAADPLNTKSVEAP